MEAEQYLLTVSKKIQKLKIEKSNMMEKYTFLDGEIHDYDGMCREDSLISEKINLLEEIKKDLENTYFDLLEGK